MTDIVGKSAKMQFIHKMIRDIADSRATILITGENGTGKELVARAIHHQSRRRDKPFIVAHCGSYAQSLVASELFGHERGSFTGAIYRKIGRFEKAHKGTLFLDEIGGLSHEIQVMLLRVLEERCFERVGGERTIQVDMRILAATNKNLAKEVAAGRFREDLYYRLNVINIFIPPLRERKEDIPLLVEHFLRKYSRIENKNIHRISNRAMDLLTNYNWPGNIRELENTVARAVILTKGEMIHEDILSLDVQGESFGKGTSLMDHERQLIWSTLQECHWNKHEVARRLGIHRATLYSKIKRYGLSPKADMRVEKH